MRIKDLMSRNFEVLYEWQAPSEASPRLAEGKLGVVVDDAGEPRSLVTAEDLRAAARLGAATLCESEATLPRTMVIELESDASDLGEEQLWHLSDGGGRGVVVIDDQKRVAGVVTFATVLCSGMARGPAALALSEAGAGSLPGYPNTEPLRRACLRCGFVNRIHFLDDHKPPLCRNPRPPHQLQFRLKGGL